MRGHRYGLRTDLKENRKHQKKTKKTENNHQKIHQEISPPISWIRFYRSRLVTQHSTRHVQLCTIISYHGMRIFGLVGPTTVTSLTSLIHRTRLATIQQERRPSNH